MAFKPRSRIVRPGFFQNPELGKVSYPAKMCFIGLWTLADREGLLENRPEMIGVTLFPYDKEIKIDDLLVELHDQKLINLYKVNESSYIQIPKFIENQNVHRDEKASQLPAPEPDMISSRNPDGFSVNQVGINNGIERRRRNSRSRIRSKNDEIPYAEIISDFNEVIGGHYKPDSQIAVKLIGQLWAAGHRLEHFKIVHRTKFKQWGGDSKMRQHLTPSTLYSGKFDIYLNQDQIKVPSISRLSEVGQRNILAGKAVLDGIERQKSENN